MRVSFRSARSVVLATTVALSASALGMPGVALAAAPRSCPEILPVEDLVLDTSGRGWTVAKGTTPEPFRVDYLGVLDDGIGAGRDLIIIEVSDVNGSTIIQDANGIWAGISGSPVYSDGKLVGSVSYSLNAGAAFLGGVTPAEDMAAILDYPGGPAAAAGANRIAVPSSLRAKLAARVGVRIDEVGSSFERLRLPLAVSGLSTRNRDRLQADMDKAGIPVIVTPGSKAPAPRGTFSQAKPGGNFAALLSYGDVTAGGIGTTTYVCNGRALAFGHPAFFTGKATLGANDANAITIVPGLIGAYKLANITLPMGRVDQDRLAGLRAQLGVAPDLIPIRSSFTARDLGVERSGRTDVAAPSFLSNIVRFHLFANFDSVQDLIGPGSAKLRWTIKGKRENGDPFELMRGNRYAANDDIAFWTGLDVSNDLATIFANPYEKVTFDRVDLDVKAHDDYQAYVLESVKISKNGGPFRQRDSLRLRVGDDVVVRGSIREFRGQAQNVDVAFTVTPEDVGDGLLLVGRNEFDVPFPGSEPAPGDDFASMIEALEDTPRNDDLSVRFQVFGPSGSQESVLGKLRLEKVVAGQIEIPTTIVP